ncbi:MAG TPA: protein tyrosine phosphatase family protein [Acidobacteriota bacterium]|nr:protein tyrosine phosphatase family protein [Acidobacteriota bacterium]
MKSLIFSLVLLFLSFSFIYAQSPDQVPNLHRIKFYVYTSGQPTEEGFRQLAAMGIKTVINVLPEKECMPNEQDIVMANNMVYRSIPFGLHGFRKQTIEYFAEILKKAEKPVLIHCKTGNHVGGMWLAYRILEEDIPLEQALKESRKIGLRQELEDELFLWLLTQKRTIV